MKIISPSFEILDEINGKEMLKRLEKEDNDGKN